jgi:hypothetical protein
MEQLIRNAEEGPIGHAEAKAVRGDRRRVHVHAGETKMSNRILTRSRAADKACRIFREDSQDKAL